MLGPQPDLFEDPPIARRSDPDTSKTAAAEYSATTRRQDTDVMAELVAEFPGKTAGEYGQILLERGFKPMKAIRMPTKRLSDLKSAGRVVVGASRKCTQSGRRAATYYVTGAAR